MGRKRNEEIPQHPTVGREVVVFTKYGADRYGVTVTCPQCQAVRVKALTEIRAAVARGGFTGRCLFCADPKPRGHLGLGRFRLPDGFIAIDERGIVDGAELALHRRIRGWPATGPAWIVEQHWLMAKLLGRPLHKYERVVHRNGRRDDNRLENLELVIVYPDGRTRPVLEALTSARSLIERYEAEEQLLREAQESRPQEADLSGPSTAASTSSNVSPAE
jgi:hypothetical protein